jgi:hypothetical protein
MERDILTSFCSRQIRAPYVVRCQCANNRGILLWPRPTSVTIEARPWSIALRTDRDNRYSATFSTSLLSTVVLGLGDT